MRRELTRPYRIVGLTLFILATLVVVALFATEIAPYDPLASSGLPLQPPGPAHRLGTNDIGQDILSEWLWGARASLWVAAVVAALSTALAWGVGMAAGFWRRAEGPLMAITDLLLALPSIPLYLLVLTLAGSSQLNVTLTLGLLAWPAFARVVRAQVIALRGQPYVEAARALGASSLRIAIAHVLPGTIELLPAKLVLTVRFAVFAEATLAFLGLGDPSAQSWGTMLGWAFNYPLLFARDVWIWWVVPPALGIVFVVLATTWLATELEARVRLTTAGRQLGLGGTTDIPREAVPESRPAGASGLTPPSPSPLTRGGRTGAGRGDAAR